ncbi:MAG: VOC family protein [Bacteroidota bacterium]
MKRALPFIVLLLLVIGCRPAEKTSLPTDGATLMDAAKQEPMNAFVSIFEIPVTDIERATEFYRQVLAIELEEFTAPGMQMGIFPVENQMNVGVLLKAEDYVPSSNGVTIYFNAGDDLQIVLDRVEPSGGQILVPKTPHADDSGFFALFLDTEGNRLGLHSPE